MCSVCNKTFYSDKNSISNKIEIIFIKVISFIPKIYCWNYIQTGGPI